MTDSTSEDVQRFHRWSRTYERSLGQRFFFDPVHRGVVDLVASHLDGRAPAQVLDIGCGTGRLLRRAALRWPKAGFVGVDPAEGMVENARRLTPFATCLVGKGEQLPFPDSSADVAFSTVSFHHWGDQAAGVREVARVLRPGGLFCLADIALPGFAAGLIPHSRIHSRGEMSLLFRQAGLQVIAQKGIRAGTVLATIGRKAREM
jgi:ubiquinone/menaquinone biosynthesis C-methylase UbiE